MDGNGCSKRHVSCAFKGGCRVAVLISKLYRMQDNSIMEFEAERSGESFVKDALDLLSLFLTKSALNGLLRRQYPQPRVQRGTLLRGEMAIAGVLELLFESLPRWSLHGGARTQDIGGGEWHHAAREEQRAG